MSPERVEIGVDTRSFDRAANITGRIWLSHGGRDEERKPFPEAHWSDFPVVILGWWLAALAHLPQQEAECRFMDGPYEFTVSDAGGTLLRVRCFGRGLTAGELVADFSTPAQAFHEAVVKAAAGALAECDRRGWTGRDVEALHRAYGEASRNPFFAR